MVLAHDPLPRELQQVGDALYQASYDWRRFMMPVMRVRFTEICHRCLSYHRCMECPMDGAGMTVHVARDIRPIHDYRPGLVAPHLFRESPRAVLTPAQRQGPVTKMPRTNSPVGAGQPASSAAAPPTPGLRGCGCWGAGFDHRRARSARSWAPPNGARAAS